MLLRDAINIPEAVQQGDLVFKLANATADPQRTIDEYVVTPQLVGAFLEATNIIGSAVTEGRSKATFLSGSFGSGKSNFMGVLQLLLDAEPAALAKPELAEAVESLSKWRVEHKFLTVPFHLIGATSLESAIFGKYVAHMRELHPEAPMPDVFADEPILENADSLRELMGDEPFFEALAGSADGSAADSGWGDLAGWNAQRYEDARNEPGGGENRSLLVQTLLTTLLSSFAERAAANRDGYVDMESGLAAMSRHASDLGYSGLILFLDELILWFMSRMADAAFVSAEASKVSKLVEASDASRPVPIISIIARQRDLRDLVGSDVPGAERLGFVAQLKFQDGRFSDIKLDDSNLVLVAHRRLLQPKNSEGADALAKAFSSLSLSDSQRDALRGANGTDEDFRLTYPFSPSFLQIVVDVAGALQRTRTGLRVLLDLLVRNRDVFEVGQLVPVGDLFDVLAEADEPLSDAMKQPFESAKRIYRITLRPMLLEAHGLASDSVPTEAFRTDDRLVKTLLLAALVPNTDPFRNLTASKLVALNHGLINTPIPGMEAAAVINKLNTWAARSGELQVGGEVNDPTVRLVLSEVDTRAILDSVSGIDNPGNRRKLVRDLLSDELGLATDQLLQTTKLLWQGQQRSVELVFGNVRNADELADSSFASAGSGWKVVVDFPFDEEGRTPLEDVARVQSLVEQGVEWRTICWIPAFFTAEMRKQLGDLVRLNHLLPVSGQISDRFLAATKNLAVEARESARPQMEAQQRAARSRLLQALKQAYGIGVPDPASVDQSHALSDHFPSLMAGFQVRPPVAATLREAFDSVVTQALAHSYPGAPPIDGEVRLSEIKTVRDLCEQALEQPDNRIPQVPPADRRIMSRIANPLRLGVQAEQAFLLDVSPQWELHFTRKLAERDKSGAEGNATVRELRAWIDEPKAMGLSTVLQDLVILVWAAATDRTFTDHGGPARTGIDSLHDSYEVVAQDLPEQAIWLEACLRAQHVLGLPGLPHEPSAVGLARLSNALTESVRTNRGEAERLLTSLQTLAALQTEQYPNRVRTAEGAVLLINALDAASTDLDKVAAFVEASLLPSAQAVAASIKSSAAAAGTITAIDLEILANALNHAEGSVLAAELTALLEAEELAMPLAPALRSLYERARDLVLAPPPPPPGPGPQGPDSPEVPPVTTVPPVPPPGTTRVSLVAEHNLERSAMIKRLKDLRKQLEVGELKGEEFDIEITAIVTTGEE